MELWLIYTLLSAVCAWFFSFSSKISVKKEHDPLLVTFYSLIIWFFCWVIMLIFSQEQLWNIWISILLWIINWIWYLITTLTRIKSLKYMDTSVYFPIYKTFQLILAIFLLVWFFDEIITNKEMLWVVLWISIPYLLIWKNIKNKNTYKWMKYLIVWLIIWLMAWMTLKLISIYNANIFLFIIFSHLSWAMFTYIFHKLDKKNKRNYSILHIKRTWIITWILSYLAFYFFANAVILWNNLWVIWVIQSLYIIIPIMLSVIIYKEHFDLKKALVLLLTIMTIFLLK